MYRAEAGGVEVAHTGSKGVKTVQRFAKRLQAQRLHVVLNVGVRLGRVAAGEGTQLRGRHAHGAGALERVLQPNQGLAPPTAGLGVERLDALDFVNRANLQMVLQIGAHARGVMQYGYPMALQECCRAHARQLQNLRRPNAAGTQNNLTSGCGGDHLLARQNLGASTALAAIGQGLKQQLGHLGAGPHLEIGPAITGGAQKRLGGVPAQTRSLVDLKVAHAFVVAGVEVIAGRNAGLLGGAGKGIQHIPAQALLVNPPLATGLSVAQLLAVGCAGIAEQFCGHTFGAVQGAGPFVMVFMQLEVGQGVGPGPGVVAGELRPSVVVARLAAHVNHAIDAAAAAQRFAARVAQCAAVQPGFSLGLEQPVGARVANAVQVTHGYVNPVVVVSAAGLNQQHALAGVSREPVGQQAARGAGADDDVVES